VANLVTGLPALALDLCVLAVLSFWIHSMPQSLVRQRDSSLAYQLALLTACSVVSVQVPGVSRPLVYDISTSEVVCFIKQMSCYELEPPQRHHLQFSFVSILTPKAILSQCMCSTVANLTHSRLFQSKAMLIPR
jgi:hypothetical protein